MRYYERRALISEPPRTRSGYRQYDPESIREIAFIKRAQALGFTLEEIRALLALRVTPETDCDSVAGQAEHAVARIDAQISALRRMRSALGRLIHQCRDRHPTNVCPLLDALDLHEENLT